MSKTFNLLLLHSRTDIHPRTWLCLRGTKLNNTFKLLEKSARNQNRLSRNALSKLISSKYGCSINTVGRILQGNTKYYPIPILLELLELNKNSKRIANQINKDAEYLKVNSATSKPVKALKSLNKNLSTKCRGRSQSLILYSSSHPVFIFVFLDEKTFGMLSFVGNSPYLTESTMAA